MVVFTGCPQVNSATRVYALLLGISCLIDGDKGPVSGYE